MSERASHAPQPENPYAQLADTVQALTEEQANKLELSYVDAVTTGTEAEHPLHTEAVQGLRTELDNTPAAVAVKEGDSEVARLEAALKNPLLRAEERDKLAQELADVQEARQLYAQDQQQHANDFRDLLSAEAHDKAVENAKWEDFFLGDSPKAQPATESNGEKQLEDLAVEKSKELVDGPATDDAEPTPSEVEEAPEAPEAEAEAEPTPAEAEAEPAPAEAAPKKNRYEQESPQERAAAIDGLLSTVDDLANKLHGARSNKTTDPTYNEDKAWEANLLSSLKNLVTRLPYLDDGQLTAVREQLIDRARKNIHQADAEIGMILTNVTSYATNELAQRLEKSGEEITEDTLKKMHADVEARINEPFDKDAAKAEEPAHPGYDGPVTPGMELAVVAPAEKAPKKKLRKKVASGAKKVVASPVKGVGALVRGWRNKAAANRAANEAFAASEAERRAMDRQRRTQEDFDEQNPDRVKELEASRDRVAAREAAAQEQAQREAEEQDDEVVVS